MTSAVAIEVEDLHKHYGSHAAVRGISFSVRRGEVFGLLGPNGAGKTTTVEILEGYRERTRGHVAVLGMDPGPRPAALRERIGIVLQSSGLYRHLTVHEAVSHWAGLYLAPRDVEETIALTGLEAAAGQRTRTLSGGQQRRLDFALALIGDPELVFLDEPTTGFDPAARRQAWAVIRDLCAGGTTVLLTTHYLDEAEHLAGRVGVLAGGRLVAEGTPEELIGGAGTTVVRFDLPPEATAADLAGVVPEGAVVAGGRVEFTTARPTAAVHAVTGWAVERGIELSGLAVSRPSLEDVYLQLAGQHHVEAGR
jgi:ABC-2 type transport system ATP-binding protein